MGGVSQAEDHAVHAHMLEALDYDRIAAAAHHAEKARDFESELQLAAECVALDGSRYLGWVLLANAAAALGKWEIVRDGVARALAIAPDLPAAHWLRSGERAFFGDWLESWRSYEYGTVQGKRLVRTILPRWNGEPIPGKTLLVWGEQGLGDCIQYSRFVALAKERSGASLVLEVREPLLRLVRPMADYAYAKPQDAWLPVQADYQVPLLSLPFALGLGADSIAGPRYIRPAEECQTGRIGFSWRGNAAHPNDHNRSIPMDAIGPILEAIGPQVVALQTDGEIPDGMPYEPVSDLLDMASVISGLDAVVTVDTAVAHLAGAMGVPTLMIAPRGKTEPRWGGERSTAWYQSMTVLHSGLLESWESIAARVADEFRAWRSA